MQISTLSAPLGFGSQLIEWYRDAISKPWTHFLSDLLPGPEKRFCFCTNTGSIPSSFYTGPAGTIEFFPQSQKSLLSVMPENVYQVSPRMQSKSSQKKPAKLKKTSCDKISNWSSIALSEKSLLKVRKVPKKDYNTKKVITHPVINHLSWWGAVCSRPCFWLEYSSNKCLNTHQVKKQELPK